MVEYRSGRDTTGLELTGRLERFPIRRGELLLILAFWTVLAILTAANAALDPRGRGPQPLTSSSVALAFAESYLWAVLTPLIFLLTSRIGIERSNWLSRVVLLFGLGVVVAMSVEALLAYLRHTLGPFGPPGRRPFSFSPFIGMRRLFWLDDFIIYVAIVAAGFARDYFLRYRAREQMASRLQAQLTEARLSALRTQLNPHFLFNTLHAISTLVDRDPPGVRRMIARLSELLRFTLEGGNEQEVPLSKELDFLERYIEIMRIRFQGRLDVRTEVEGRVMDALVPTLILQPLVENALEHGVSRVDGGGRVIVRASLDGDRVVLAVTDDGPGLPPSFEERVGLRNTRDRLAQLYGGDQSLTMQASNGSSGLTVEVSLPYHTRADLRAAVVSDAR